MVLQSYPNRNMASHVEETFSASHSFEPLLPLMRNKIKVGAELGVVRCQNLILFAGQHEFSWAILPHKGHFLESDVPIAGYLFNSPMYCIYRRFPASTLTLTNFLVRHANTELLCSVATRPFTLEGPHNVFLETIKRGEHDDFSGNAPTTISIVLRLYEAYGGHSQVRLKIASHLPVFRAFLTNLLEEECGELSFKRTNDSGETILELDFRGFEVKTVKLIINDIVQRRVQTPRSYS
jgi:alpha-mannosidase